MKKNILSLAVASSVAGLAVSAQAAMYLNPEGTGEVLLFPYYNAQNGNQTSMSIVNTNPEAKAVKVRFMEYVNSQEVLDFNLYMSAGDHFSFTIFQDPERRWWRDCYARQLLHRPRAGYGQRRLRRHQRLTTRTAVYHSHHSLS